MSTDPKLTRSRVVVAYHADDGYKSEETYRSHQGGKTCGGMPMKPQEALLVGLEELAHLTALFGFEEEALSRFNAARQRVADWRATRQEPNHG